MYAKVLKTFASRIAKARTFKTGTHVAKRASRGGTKTRYVVGAVGAYAAYDYISDRRRKEEGCFIELIGSKECRLRNRSCNALVSVSDCPDAKLPAWLLPKAKCDGATNDATCVSCSIQDLLSENPDAKDEIRRSVLKLECRKKSILTSSFRYLSNAFTETFRGYLRHVYLVMSLVIGIIALCFIAKILSKIKKNPVLYCKL